MIKRFYIETANNFALCVIVYFASILIASGVFMAVEGFALNKALWFSFITSLTIGYGDISPATSLGRFFTVLFSLQWILYIIPCFLVNMINIVKRDDDKFSHEEQEQFKQELINLRQQNTAQLVILQQLHDRYLREGRG